MSTKLPSLARILTTFSIILILALPVLSIRPVFAARIFEDGFESGDFSKWNPVVGNPSVTSGDAHHGTYKAVLNASYQFAQARFTNVDHCFMRAYVMFKSFPTSGAETPLLGLYNTSGRYMAEARVGNVSGTIKWKLRYYDNGTHYTVVSEQQKPVLNTWYCVEVEGKSNTAANAESRIYIDGNELTDVSEIGKNNTFLINCAYIWESVTGSVTLWYDCVVVDGAYIGPECTLTVNVVGSGSVAKIPDQAIYAWGTNVTLTATPTSGWSFDHWSGGSSGTVNPITVNMTSNKDVTATFTQNTYTLTVNVVGSGSVNLNNTGPYYYGDVVQVTAVPDSGWSFDHWGGDLAGSANPATLIINSDTDVTATFAQNVYTLTVDVVGDGVVNLNNTGPYHYGDVVQLTAAPSTGWSFANWGGDLTGSSNPTTIIIDGDKAATATFTQDTYTLTVSIDPLGKGSVNLNNSGPYYYGDTVELTANPAIGWSFDHWSGDSSGSSNPTTLLINGNKAVTATFTQNVYTLTTTVIGSGSVSRNSSGPYYYGDTVELTAVPSAGRSFDHWDGDLSGSTNPTTILITENKDVSVTFTQNEYTLTVNVVGDGVVNRDKSGPYHYDDVVQLTAVPSAGWSFDHWNGDLSGSVNPDTVLINSDMSVTATFTQVVVETHDVAVTDVDTSKTGCLPVPIVCKGYNCSIFVGVENKGDFAETFNVTVYANTTAIQTETLTLEGHSSTTLTITWDTTSFAKGNYTISAYAWPVEGETETEDNTFVDGWIFVTMPGDVNANGRVNIVDVVQVALAFGSTHSDPIPPWNPNADINNDGVVNIIDIVVVGLHFGETG